MTILKQELTSSALSEAKYDTETKELTLIFRRNEAEYKRQNVPLRVYRELINCTSPGEYFNFWIRGVDFGNPEEGNTS